MKGKCALLLVLFVFFIIGCGGGGGGTAGDNASPGSAADNSGNGSGTYTAKITVQFPEEESASKKVALTTSVSVPTTITATHARLVVRRTVIGDVTKTETRRVCYEDGCSMVTGPVTYHNVTYDANKYIADGAIPGAVSITMPPDKAYTLEVLTYKLNDDGTKSMVKYAKTNAFDITAGENKDIALTGVLLPIAVGITPPDAVISGYDYSVAVDLNKYDVPSIDGTYLITAAPAADDYTTRPAVTTLTATPLRSTGNLLKETSDVIVDPPFSPVTVGGVVGATAGMVNFTFTPPVVATSSTLKDPITKATVPWQLGFTGTFYINDNLLKYDELTHWSDWVCNPAPTGNISTLTPQGGVIISF